jgi:ribonuclease HII
MASPTLRYERELLRSGATLLGCVDEVGRGALSGPVTLGIVVVSIDTKSAPQGVRDSKLLSAAVREALAPKIRRWALDHAVGHASADEIDEFGLMAAMRLAGRRALAQLDRAPDLLLLDGNHDYLSPPVQEGLFGDPELSDVPRVVTRIKADMRCAGVAAASVLAKTTRDAIMLDLDVEHPEYCWAENKGYSAPAHLDALGRLGPTRHHRRSWSLPGVESLGSTS